MSVPIACYLMLLYCMTPNQKAVNKINGFLAFASLEAVRGLVSCRPSWGCGDELRLHLLVLVVFVLVVHIGLIQPALRLILVHRVIKFYGVTGDRVDVGRLRVSVDIRTSRFC